MGSVSFDGYCTFGGDIAALGSFDGIIAVLVSDLSDGFDSTTVDVPAAFENSTTDGPAASELARSQRRNRKGRLGVVGPFARPEASASFAKRSRRRCHQWQPSSPHQWHSRVSSKVAAVAASCYN